MDETRRRAGDEPKKWIEMLTSIACPAPDPWYGIIACAWRWRISIDIDSVSRQFLSSRIH